VTWRVDHDVSTPAAFHAREVPEPAPRSVWVCEATAPALVLGSAQAEARVDREACAAAGIDVVRRRSGGGAVLVGPGEPLWVDLVIPAGDPLWRADVGEAFHWVGAAWAGALGALGVTAAVHHGGLLRGPWAADVCFGGLGPGEVSVGGRKVVGISQRRTRHWARFQCAALGRWDPAVLLGLLRLDPGEQGAAEADLSGRALGLEVDLDDLLAALLRHRP
jgi:lipoate-protein ligase A